MVRSLRRAGRLSWSIVGILVVAVAVGYLASILSLVVIPVILALFPATLLSPVHRLLRGWGLPSAVAALATLLGGIILFVAVVGAMIALVVAELPDIADSVGEGVGRIEDLISRVAPETTLGDLLAMAREQVGEVGDVAAEAADLTLRAFETVAGIVLAVVVLFFYLKDGRGLVESLLEAFVPADWRPRAIQTAEGAWDTLGRYFRGQLLVALVDAVAIGIGLLILGVPLALPLAVLVFFGGLFPIVGAVVTGSVAVLVALADGGLLIGAIVAGLVLAVQQLEGNVLEPLILSHAIDLSPLLIVLVITAGAMVLGVLGAFLAVPVAAIVKRAAHDLRSPAGEEEPTSAVPVG